MSIIETLITNRTQDDVSEYFAIADRFKNKTYTSEDLSRWNEGKLKGTYNLSDLNRVIEAVEYLSSLFNSEGYKDYVVPLNKFNEQSEPNFSELETYIKNVEKIRSVFNTYGITPSSAIKLTITGANEIEKILIAADDELRRVKSSYVYSNQVYCGQIWEDFE